MLRVPGLVPDMGRGQNVMSAVDFHQGPGSNEPETRYRILRQQGKYRNEIVLEMTANVIQHDLWDILYWNVGLQMILLWRLTP